MKGGNNIIYIGIDGGGTKTMCAAYESGQLAATSKSGPMNYNFIGIERAAENLLAGIRALGIPSEQIAAVGIGDPSLDDGVPEEDASLAAQFLQRIRTALGVPVFVRSDAYITLFGLTGGTRPGVLMLSGTGAMGIAENAAGEIRAAGGWGRLTGDEGSGYYIAVEAIRAALHAADGIAPQTALTDALCTYFGVTSPRDLIPCFYPETGEPDVAGFARIAAKTADAGDETARHILHDAARYLADYASALIDWSESRLVGIYGSVITENQTVRHEFTRRLSEKYPDIEITPPPVSAERAAAMYAEYQIKKGLLT